MPAPAGNKYWELRSTHGRERLFSSPNLLWQAACEYFEWCKANPWIKNDFVSGGPNAGAKVQLETERPMSLSGLYIYLGCNKHYFNDFKAYIKDSTKKKDKDFSEIIARIEDIIETQQFEGAMVGAFHAGIVSRKLGLVDKQQSDINVQGGWDITMDIK